MKWNRYTPIDKRIDLNSTPEPNSGCVLWLGKVNERGYGKIKNNGKEHRVHRLVYQLHNPGEDISEKVICHKCDVPSCVNPDHLFSGEQADNMRDMLEKGRHRGGAKAGNQNAKGNKGWAVAYRNKYGVDYS